MTQNELDALKRRTTYELMLHDPRPVLDALGIEYKEIANDSYRMNLRGEKTPSAFISLKNGVWKYKDFGTDKNGNIANVVMDATQKDFKTSLNFALQKLGATNYLDVALDNVAQQVKIEKIEKLKQENHLKSQSHTVSRVTKTYEISTNQLAQDYLKSRGIVKIPEQLKIINGEYIAKSGETKKAWGVGIMMDSGGADIHFLKKIGDLKTMSFGEKDISFFKNENSDKVAIFESKMDYAAAYQQIPLQKVNIIIANSTSNAQKVAEVLKKENLNKVMFFNQNDASGLEFVEKIAQKADIQNFKTVKYDISEIKKDVNDLILKDVKLADRIQISNLQSVEKEKNAVKIFSNYKDKTCITREDLKRDSQLIQNQNKTQQKDRGNER